MEETNLTPEALLALAEAILEENMEAFLELAK